jgi:hypothetical protein
MSKAMRAKKSRKKNPKPLSPRAVRRLLAEGQRLSDEVRKEMAPLFDLRDARGMRFQAHV